ncbi:MFS transporter [Agrilactobacillus yilanensis]|uniref:MFS transporter n=1 Tax=Agrilactobacillus yilanensis TaxID=2485997 RepID=A0ABW4J8T9_9LACO|nr:MFS transporter [Agrilactobacillus yilanensis]
MNSNRSKFGMVLPIILISYFMLVLDNSIIFTSTVKISNDLGLTATSLSWVSTAYALTFGGLLLIGGRMGDIFGRKKMLLVGLLIFSISSLFVGASVNGLMIILMRAAQGIGSAILAPTTLALLMDSYTGKMRIRAIAAYGATAGIGASFGLVIGGLIASFWTWRWGFFVNVPVGILLFVLTVIFVKDYTEKKEQKIDLAGTALSILGLSLLIYSIVGEQYKILTGILAAVLLIFFVLIEKNTTVPLMPLKIYVDWERSCAYFARFFYMGAMMSYWFLTPQAMQNVYRFTPLQAGAAFLPMTLIQFISAMLTSRLSARWGNTKLLIIGVTTTLIGPGLSTLIGIQAGYIWAIALPMIFLGIGQGFSLSALTTAGIANTDRNLAGAASGVINMIHQIGGSVGLALAVAVGSHFLNFSLNYRVSTGIVTIYLALSTIAVVIIAIKNKK